MASVAKNLSAKFVISVGDNFYDDGVASTADSRWHTAFSKMLRFGHVSSS